MNYVKPEVATLGDASLLIESMPQKDSLTSDNKAGPAYDLDE